MWRKFSLIFIFTVYLLYHFATLSISPLPWFDETFFASISHTYLNSGVFQAKIAMIMNNGREVVEYGPLYFLFTSFSLKLFGFGIFQFRIISLLFGFVILFLFYKLLPTSKNSLLFVSLLSFDTIFHSNMHGGRMDTMAVALILLSVYFFLKSCTEHYYKNIFISSLFAVSAILTTPRSGFFLIPIGLILLYHFIRHKRRKHFFAILIWIFTILVIYIPWFYYAFDGSADMFIRYYMEANNMIKVGFFIPKFQYPLIFVAAIAVLYGIYSRKIYYFSELNIIAIINILLFYFVIRDTGTYSVFIIPFYYLLIADGLNASERFLLKDFKFILVSFLLFFNLCIFLFKSFVLFSDFNIRQPHIADKFVAKYIPAGSKVIGDEIYYYSVIKSGSDFQYISLYGTDRERERYQRATYDYDYILLSNNLSRRKPGLLKLYQNNTVLEKVSEINIPKLSRLIQSLNINIFDTYNCTLYKRKR